MTQPIGVKLDFRWLNSIIFDFCELSDIIKICVKYIYKMWFGKRASIM